MAAQIALSAELRKLIEDRLEQTLIGVNSRTLSDKLKLLTKHGYIQRDVTSGPPIRVEYTLTTKGKNTVLLALPLLYYATSS